MTQDTPLSDAITLQRGFDLPTSQRKPGRYPVVTSTGMATTHDEFKVKSPGVVIGRSGSIGGGQYIESDFWPLNTTLWVKDFKGNNEKFIYYLLKSLDFSSFNAGAAVPTLNRNHLSALKVRIPERTEQDKIADILGTIDEKIELNRRMNETLEQMGQALFRHYFIDNPEAKKWKTVNISDLIDFIGGSQPPKSEHIYEPQEGYVRFVQNRDYSSDSHKTYIPVAKRNKLCTKTDIMMDKYGEAGCVRFGIAGAYNVALAKIVPRCDNMQEYLRSYFAMPQIQHSLEGAAAASTRSSLNATTFAGLKIQLPPNDLLSQYELSQKDVIYSAMENTQQIQTLTTLRDTLLPRLISGKVKV